MILCSYQTLSLYILINDCKIYQAAFIKSPAKSKNFKAYSFTYF